MSLPPSLRNRTLILFQNQRWDVSCSSYCMVNLHGFFGSLPLPKIHLAGSIDTRASLLLPSPPETLGSQFCHIHPEKSGRICICALSRPYVIILGGASDWPSLGHMTVSGLKSVERQSVSSLADYSDRRRGPAFIHFVFSPNRKEIQTTSTNVKSLLYLVYASRSGQSSKLQLV